MAWTSGTATSLNDLMDKFKAHVTNMGAQSWTTKRDQANGDGTWEFIFMAPGLSGADQIYVGMKTFFSSTLDYYNIQLNGFLGYDSSATWEKQPGAISNYTPAFSPKVFVPQIPLWNQNMPYWIAANGRRAVMIVKVSTRYEAMYLGLIKPYGTSGMFPYPLFVGGSMTGKLDTSATNPSTNYKFSSDNQDHHHFTNPGISTDVRSTPYTGGLVEGYHYFTALLRTGNGWVPFCNVNYGNNIMMGNMSTGFGNVWPTCSASYYESQRYLGSPTDLTTNLDGSYPLFPFILNDSTPNTYGELDGCYWCTGHANSPESIITVGSDSYFVVQDVARSGTADFWCLKRE